MYRNLFIYLIVDFTFDGAVMVQQQVLRLEIAMHDHVAMAVVDSGDDLLEKPPRLRLFQLSILDDVFEQFSSRHILQVNSMIRGQLWSHNGTPFEQPTTGRPIGCLRVGRPQGVVGVF
jgi:hypothetical protein